MVKTKSQKQSRKDSDSKSDSTSSADKQSSEGAKEIMNLSGVEKSNSSYENKKVVDNYHTRQIITSQVPLDDVENSKFSKTCEVDVKKGMKYLGERISSETLYIYERRLKKALQLTAQSAYKRGLKDGKER